MKTPEDEAFEDIERRQGGFQAKRQMAADRLQEPVAWGFKSADGAIYDCIPSEAHDDYEGSYNVPLYTTPPKREWVGLTPKDTEGFTSQEMTLAKYVSKVLQEKNT